MSHIKHIFEQKALYYEETIKAFQIYRCGAYESDLNLLKWLGDFSFFTILGSYDLWILLCDFEETQKKYPRNFYARQTALICFELLNDVSELMNQNYQLLLIEKIQNDSIVSEALNIRKKLNKIRNEKIKELKEIRDFVAAHRDHDISNQIKVINNMSNEKIMDFSISYLKSIEQLHILLNKTIIFLNNEQKEIGNDQFYDKYKID